MLDDSRKWNKEAMVQIAELKSTVTEYEEGIKDGHDQITALKEIVSE